MGFTITYNGRNYFFGEVAKKQRAEKLATFILKNLERFSKTIEQHNGQVLVDIGWDLENTSIKFLNVPPGTIDRINSALYD